MNIALIVLIAIVGWMVFVSQYNDLFQPKFTVIVRDTSQALDEFFDGRIAAELKLVHEFALLSAAVYEKKLENELCDNKDVENPPLILWERIALENLPTRPQDEKNWSLNWGKGLKYEVRYRTEPNDRNEQLVAIVFRGTEKLSDHLSNLHWYLRFIPFTFDQYDVVRAVTPEIVTRITEKFGSDVQIIATGHSLGGGLAHQAAYAADNIKTVYAFDPSSVTGFKRVKKKVRDQRVQGMRIYRIYERGEILAYLRRFMALFYPVSARNPQIVEVRYNFKGLKGNFASDLHSIEDLACNLRTVALERPEKI